MIAETRPDNDHDGDLDDDVNEDVIERLRRLNPVDVDSLPSSRRAEAMRALEGILGPDDDTEPA